MPNSLPARAGQTRQLLTETDWTSSTLGPAAQWSEALRVALAICQASRQPTCLWWGDALSSLYNDAYISLLGPRHPEAFGLPAATLWPELWDQVGPRVQAVRRRAEPLQNERLRLVSELNGYLEERYFTWSYAPIPQADGTVGGVLCTCTEETDSVLTARAHERMVERIEGERMRLAAAFAQSPAFVAVMNGPDHVIQYANERYCQLMHRRDLVGKKFADIAPLHDRQLALDTLDAVYRTGVAQMESSARVLFEPGDRADPEERYLDYVCQPMRGPAGDVIGVLAHGVDITEPKLAEHRDHFLLSLEEAIRTLRDPTEITATCARLLGEHLQANRCAYADVEDDQDTFNLTGDYNRGVPSMVGRYRFSDFGHEVVECMRGNRPYVQTQVDAPPPGATLTAFAHMGIRSVICTPLHKAGRFVGAMAVHQLTPRRWRASDVELVQHVLSRCWEAMERSRVTRELVASEERFRAAVNATSSILWTNDAAGRMTGEQPGWSAFTGQQRSAYEGYGWTAVVHPDDAAASLSAWVSTVAAETTFVFEHRLRRADGQYRNCSVRAVPVRDGHGNIREWVGVHTDITDQRQFEQSLQESETRFRNMSDNAPVMIWMTRADGQCEYLNARWYAFTGQRDSDALGLGWMGALHPDDAGRVKATFLDANSSRRSFQIEYRLRRNDDEYRWCIDAASPRVTGQGEFLGYIGSVVDINDRKRAQDALATEKRVLELVATRASLQEVLDTIVSSIEAQSNDGMLCSIAIDDSAGKLVDSGTHRSVPANAHLSPILASDGKALGLVATHYSGEHAPSTHDLELARSATHLAGIVIERHMIDRQLRDLFEAEHRARALAERESRTKDEFLASLSHELRTPLTAILGWAQILKVKTGLPAELQKATEVIERNARAQVKIVEDLLNMSAIISGKLRLETQTVDLRAALQAALDTARPAADAKRIRVVCMLGAASDLQVRGDPNRLQQILWNLLSNAIKFTPEGGNVRVEAGCIDARVQVSVSDDGEGVAPDFLPYVFDRFRQADASSTRRHGGLGLGLSIVRQLVELHGGSVTAQSAGRGAGSTFVVTLPVAHARAKSDTQLQPVAVPATRLASDHPSSVTPISGMRVLVVDDEEDARELVKHMLESSQASVVTAESAAEALSLVRDGAFDVLVSDIGMPGADGNELMRNIRRLGPDQGGEIPAVALTAYAQAEDRRRALDAGFQRHMTKPVDPNELVHALASVSESGRDTDIHEAPSHQD